MADALLTYFSQTLPPELASLSLPYVKKLEHGEYESLLRDPEAQTLLGHNENPQAEEVRLENFRSWNDFIFHRLGVILADRSKPEKQYALFCIGYAALLSFLQSTVTGTPLSFSSAKNLLPRDVAESNDKTRTVRQALVASLGMDGIAAYKLTPNLELLCLADAVVTCPPILKNVKVARWAKVRVEFVQQRLLSEVSASLQDVIYDDLRFLEDDFFSEHDGSRLSGDGETEFLLERATIHIHHGLDRLAQADLEKAKVKHNFEFALTGLLGKRTKFQEKGTSQLVVLAKSETDTDGSNGGTEPERQTSISNNTPGTNIIAPKNLDLNDDTLLESISFTQELQSSTRIIDHNTLPSSLASLDPSNQPQLGPLDSVILLSLASSITNTSPQHGLTREETLPYATRVLEGGSTNWQVYTQALLLRSRIEGYHSRTVERGLLQLQALVDEVIAVTSGDSTVTDNHADESQATSFLPKAKEGESASAADRLRYIFQLASPSRWDLEAELAARWVQLGGLRSALDIYERLEMWAEAALCWAATEREDKARIIVRRQLFYATDGGPDKAENSVADEETWSGPPRDPPPLDAPRLYCILGDIDQSPEMYGKAWEVSNQRFARAQRSLGRYHFANKDFVKAAEAYSKSLKANQLNQSTWFALGCVYLELEQFAKAGEAFSRCVQLDESDAESWSNLAAALLRRDPELEGNANGNTDRENSEDEIDARDAPEKAVQKHRRDALNALKKAASLKHDSYRIWENVLIVAASISPPDYNSILAAQRRIIELRGRTEGEKCIDVEILELLVQHVMAISDQYYSEQPGLPRMVVKFIDQSVTPLITASSDLWRLVSTLALWRKKPSSALDAEEKAWRTITSQPGWETESKGMWNAVVEATVRLCDSYESLGPREKTEGLGAGEPVAKDWKFKARSAVRGILGRGKESWEETSGWERLKEVMEGLKG